MKTKEQLAKEHHLQKLDKANALIDELERALFSYSYEKNHGFNAREALEKIKLYKENK